MTSKYSVSDCLCIAECDVPPHTWAMWYDAWCAATWSLIGCWRRKEILTFHENSCRKGKYLKCLLKNVLSDFCKGRTFVKYSLHNIGMLFAFILFHQDGGNDNFCPCFLAFSSSKCCTVPWINSSEQKGFNPVDACQSSWVPFQKTSFFLKKNIALPFHCMNKIVP